MGGDTGIGRVPVIGMDSSVISLASWVFMMAAVDLVCWGWMSCGYVAGKGTDTQKIHVVNVHMAISTTYATDNNLKFLLLGPTVLTYVHNYISMMVQFSNKWVIKKLKQFAQLKTHQH